MEQNQAFDHRLAVECASAFSAATGLGCTVSDKDGAILFEKGYGCASCRMCGLAGLKHENCIQTHIYGMSEAERFGGKYIYFGPMGLTFFVSPILGSEGSEAKITVGPFLMVELQDYIACDLKEQMKIPEEKLPALCRELENIPFVAPDIVSHLSTLLFMSVGFLNNVSSSNRMLETQDSDAIQGQITAYIQYLKSTNEPPRYPFATEKALLQAVEHADKPEAQRLLNEMFGFIFFSQSGDFDGAKSRVYELLVLISRSAIQAGGDPEEMLRLSQQYLHDLGNLSDIDSLCFWLTGVMNTFMDRIFNYRNAKHASVIHQSIQYLNAHYSEHVTLEQMAQLVFLSPAYFSRVFKQETGLSFNTYLNKVRIEHSKAILLKQSIRLTDAAMLVGFEDQSYFTKVFKKFTGVTPLHYRAARMNVNEGEKRPEKT